MIFSRRVHAKNVTSKSLNTYAYPVWIWNYITRLLFTDKRSKICVKLIAPIYLWIIIFTYVYIPLPVYKHMSNYDVMHQLYVSAFEIEMFIQ